MYKAKQKQFFLLQQIHLVNFKEILLFRTRFAISKHCQHQNFPHIAVYVYDIFPLTYLSHILCEYYTFKQFRTFHSLDICL